MKRVASALLVVTFIILGCSVATTETQMADVNPGTEFYFGHYVPDNDSNNVAEPIELIVPSVEEGKALLISRYALNCIEGAESPFLSSAPSTCCARYRSYSQLVAVQSRAMNLATARMSIKTCSTPCSLDRSSQRKN